MRFFDLVEKHNGVRFAADLFRQLSPFFVADISGRRSDKPRHGELFHVLAHVDADQRIFGIEQVTGKRLRHFGLADAGRTEEDERADRAARIFQSRAGPADRFRQLSSTLHPGR